MLQLFKASEGLDGAMSSIGRIAKSRLRRDLSRSWLTYFFMPLVLGGCLETEPGRPYSYSYPLLERILAADAVPTPFTKIFFEQPWDTVCHLTEHMQPSRMLGRQEYLGIDISGFKFVPRDEFTMENDEMITFVDQNRKIIHGFLFKNHINKKTSRPAVSTIAGPACLKRENAYFVFKDVKRDYSVYTKLVFISRKPGNPK